MVRGASKAAPAQALVGFEIPPDKFSDPRAYRTAAASVQNAVLRAEINSNDGQRMIAMIKENCEAFTGVSFADVAREMQDPITGFKGLMESGEDEFTRLSRAIQLIDDVRVTADLKKKWLKLIEKVGDLQAECREDAAKAWVYISRNDEPEHVDELLEMQAFHLRMFDTWNDPDKLHSLIEAPVGHGKSTNLRGQIVWEIGRDPSIRCLYITDQLSKARKTVETIKRILKSPRYRALFPEVRVLGRSDDSEDSSQRFTVTRRNWSSREPTFEGAAISSRIQGNRYDRIYGDDFTPADAEIHQSTRDMVEANWKGVVEARIANPATARIRIICTPWHPADISGTTAKDVSEGRLKGWRVEIDAFAIKDDEQGKAIPLWPGKWDRDFLESRKERDGKKYDFKYRLKSASDSSQIVTRVCYYNSDPTSEGTTPRDKELLEMLAGSERWLSVDPAGTAADYSSDTGVVEFIITPRGYVFVPNVWFMHCTITEVTERICKIVLNAPDRGYTGIQWETAGAVKVGFSAVILNLQRMLKEKGYPIQSLEMLTTNTMVGGARQNRSKIVRLKDVAGFLEAGLVRFAGRRMRNHRFPLGHPKSSYLGAIKGTNIEKFAGHILNFDGQRKSDAIDALDQWILQNRGRIHKMEGPLHTGPVQVERLPANASPQLRRFAAQIDDMERRALEPKDEHSEEQAFLADRFGGTERVA